MTDELSYGVVAAPVLAPKAVRIQWVADGYRVEFPKILSELEFVRANQVLYHTSSRFEWSRDRSTVTLYGGPYSLEQARVLFQPEVSGTATGRVGQDADLGEVWLDLYLCGSLIRAQVDGIIDDLRKHLGLRVELGPGAESRRVRVWGIPHTRQESARNRMLPDEPPASIIAVPASWLAGLEDPRVSLAVTLIES